MEEIVNIKGKAYKISAENVSPERWLEIKADTIRQLERQTMALGPASCPSSIYQGTMKPVNVTINGGTAPFNWSWKADGIEKITGTNATNSFIINYTFSEAVGSHVYRLDVSDSCPTGALTASDQCTINIVVCPTISCAFSIA